MPTIIIMTIIIIIIIKKKEKRKKKNKSLHFPHFLQILVSLLQILTLL